MDREEALRVIKDIFERCREIEGKSLTLLPPKDSGELSHTFQIHIRTAEPILTSCVEKIAKEHGLAGFQEENYFVVYKPHPKNKNKISQR